MPKRDEKYMEAQRNAIARAALTVLVEKGYYETSLRDICRAAKVSNGALYSYFPTRESVIVAACAIDQSQAMSEDLPTSWDEYIELAVEDLAPGTYRSRRLRLALQFAAELSQMDQSPEGLSALYQGYREGFRRALARLHELGIITLPLGLDATIDIHSQMYMGLSYQIASNRDLDHGPAIAAYRTGMATTAGLADFAKVGNRKV
jgi:AcrR family transcriptional regulator